MLHFKLAQVSIDQIVQRSVSPAGSFVPTKNAATVLQTVRLIYFIYSYNLCQFYFSAKSDDKKEEVLLQAIGLVLVVVLLVFTTCSVVVI